MEVWLPVVIMVNLAIVPRTDVWIFPKEFKTGPECGEYVKENKEVLFYLAIMAYQFRIPPSNLLCLSSTKLRELDWRRNPYSDDPKPQLKQGDTAI